MRRPRSAAAEFGAMSRGEHPGAVGHMSTGGDCAPPRATNARSAVNAAREPLVLRAIDRCAETSWSPRCLPSLVSCSPMFWRASCSTTRFSGRTRWPACPCRSWRSSAARWPIAAVTMLSSASSSISYPRRSSASASLSPTSSCFRRQPHGNRVGRIHRLQLGERTPILQLPAALIALPLPLGMALLALHAIEHICPVTANAWRFCVAAALRGDTRRRRGDTRGLWLAYLGGDAAIGVALVFVLRCDFRRRAGGLRAAPGHGHLSVGGGCRFFVVLPQTMVNGTGNFILLAVPFFILAGLIMERGGISVRLMRFIHALVGHLRGGLLQVTVLACMSISGLSGSKPADVAAVGTDHARRSCATVTGLPKARPCSRSSAIMGETVPPSIAMLIVGSITNVSVGAHVHRRHHSRGGNGALPNGADPICAPVAPARSAAPRAPLRMMARDWLRCDFAAVDAGHAAGGHCLASRPRQKSRRFAVIYGARARHAASIAR